MHRILSLARIPWVSFLLLAVLLLLLLLLFENGLILFLFSHFPRRVRGECTDSLSEGARA